VKPFNPVISITRKGRLLNGVLRLFYRLLHVFMHKTWKHPKPGFHEDPLHYSGSDVLYFGYKYYGYPHTEAESPALADHFRNQAEGFVSSLPTTDSAVLSIGGDLMPYQVLNSAHTDALWEEAGKRYFGADLVFANLETPMYLQKPAAWVPEVMLSNMYFNGDMGLWNIFTDRGRGQYHMLSVANNHMLDQGYAGLAATRKFLEERQIAYAGSRATTEFNPHNQIIEKKGIRFGFSAWTYSLNALRPDPSRNWETNLLALNRENCDLEPLLAECRALREAGAEVLVLSLHAGNAYQCFPQQHVINNFRRAMECSGANLIIGTHAHNPQPWEFRSWQNSKGETQEGLILYSMGDFVAYDIFKWCHLPLTARITYGRNSTGKVFLHTFEPIFYWLEHTADNALIFRDFKSLMKQEAGELSTEFRELLYFYRHTFPQSGLFNTTF
jgi:hypothetical protein